MTTAEVRKKFLEFYEKRGHKVIPSAPLVPENDPTTLFTGSGMQPLIPYLLGQPHPEGKRLVDSQKSFRSMDIDDVGDNRHTTFFEMLGNWSLGDYFKAEQLPWVFEFLTNEVGLDPKKLFVSVFRGDHATKIEADDEAVKIWKEIFSTKDINAEFADLRSEAEASERGTRPNERIFAYDVKKNWWSRSGEPAKMPVGEPGGPDSEIFYEFSYIEHDPKYGKHCHPNCDCGRYMEIGNSVFMEYKKENDGSFSLLPQKNVDFGGGLERIVAASIDANDVFQIDVFKGLIATLEGLSAKDYKDPEYIAAFRVVADHIRSSVFLIGDGVIPGNSEQGYFVRRLLRRAIRFWDKLGIPDAGISALVSPLLSFYEEAYPGTWEKREFIADEIKKEEERFRKTLIQGMKEFEKGKDPFVLFSTYGFPFELTLELAKEKGIEVNLEEFEKKMKDHQDLSRAGSEKKFKGGLGDTSDKSLQYHTATHLLQQALRDVLGAHVGQKGSNITPERLRFDFTHTAKMTPEEIQKVEEIVNAKIKAGLPVQVASLPKEEAVKTGAIHFFGEKYPDTVTVYYVGEDLDHAYSKEFCGGPHVTNTSELKGTFKIQKEEAVSQGVRRIKAVLE
ncbi:MAG: alanine--tRNA ligase [Candidatus Paceibacterota bacterium]|jgi:alanyl-tRNA synthetase